MSTTVPIPCRMRPTVAEREKLACGLSRREGLLDELPHLLVAERLHALLHVRGPVGAVLMHFAEARGNLRVSAGEAFHEFFPARRQSLRPGASGIPSECRIHISEKIRPFLRPALLILWRPELFALFDFGLGFFDVIFFDQSMLSCISITSMILFKIAESGRFPGAVVFSAS